MLACLAQAAHRAAEPASSCRCFPPHAKRPVAGAINGWLVIDGFRFAQPILRGCPQELGAQINRGSNGGRRLSAFRPTCGAAA